MAEYGPQAVVWQTAVKPAVALELLDSGAWSGTGVLGPEALPAEPFLEVLPFSAQAGRRSQVRLVAAQAVAVMSTGPASGSRRWHCSRSAVR
jgi:saccharopine dehydrogenase-like NADP-dependent oxidoreductase